MECEELGRRQEALDATSEAIEVYRQLADSEPTAFEPDLALGLSTFAEVRVKQCAQLPRVLSAAQESWTICTRLAGSLPHLLSGDLYATVNTLAKVFDSLGQAAKETGETGETGELTRPASGDRWCEEGGVPASDCSALVGGEDSEALGGFGPPMDVPASVSVNGSHGTADKGQEGPP